ncbi:MAG: DUF3810 domain-containing protein [Limnohabitans sp.]|nr:DUF3810 domain-containing protein [Limnohabitans sp.]
MQFIHRKYLLIYFLIFQILFLKWIALFPNWVEKYYSNGIYGFISIISRNIFGRIPFSVGDVLYGVLIIYILYWLKKNWNKTTKKEKFIASLNLISIVYFLFHLLWALNYYRLPLSQKMDLKTDYTDKQLIAFTEKLIAKTNEIQFQITKDTAVKVTVPYNQEQIFEKALLGYKQLSEVHPEFKYKIPSQKTSLISTVLTYMGFGGYLNPFTNEAQVNGLIPLHNFPATTCHEMAHQIGYGSESECNFIGFLACHNNPDLYFKYAAYTYALHFCFSNIGAKDEKLLDTFLKKINPGVMKNFQESKDFWLSHRTFIDKGFEIFYDNFLKMNQQQEGLESYSRFIDLLINYYQK